jgi:hypothetical protein
VSSRPSKRIDPRAFLHEAHERPSDRGLAGARLADDRERLALLERKARPIDRAEGLRALPEEARLLAEFDRDLVDLDERLPFRPALFPLAALDGSDSSNIFVYSCFGSRRIACVSPSSTTLPCRSITTWSA